MFTADDYTAARKIAAEFNQAHGGQLLVVTDPPPEQVTFADLRSLALSAPGDYLAVNAFLAIKGRRPSHVESIKLGQLLGFLTVARKKHGASTLWRLDNAFAQRSH